MAEFVSNITLGELYLSIIGISVVCEVLWRIIDAVIKAMNKAKAPENEQNRRISQAEKDIAEIRKMLSNDDSRLKELEDSNRIIQKSLLALLKHGIDGNEIDSMKSAQKEIEDYLINR